MSITASSVASPVHKNTDVRISSPYYTLSDDGSYSCQLCLQSYSCESDFKRHSATHFSAETLTCMLCQQKYARERSLRCHMNEHHAMGPVMCKICSAVLADRSSLRKHMDKHSDEGFHCALCDKQLSCKGSLQRHMLSHAKPEHECALCHKKFKLKQSLLCHMQSLHSNDRPYKCDDCDRAFKRDAHLRRHKLTHTGRGEKLFTCPICRTGFARKHHLDRHLFIHYRDDTHSRNKCDEISHLRVLTKMRSLDVECELCQPTQCFPNTEEFMCHLAHHYDFGEMCCDICKKHFASKKLLRQHLKCHKETFECEICKHHFKSAKLLRRHMIVYHDSQTACLFKCKLCQESFATDSQLIQHVKQVHNDVEGPKFPCSYCDHIFCSESLLMSHLAVHKMRMSFKCSVCKRRLSSKNVWIYHMMVQHSGGKVFATKTLKRQENERYRRYTCDECDCTFKSDRQLHRHKRRHAKNGSGSSMSRRQRIARVTNGHHQCDDCAKVFQRKAQLTRHVQQVHQDQKPPICCICNKVFKTAADLAKHERFHSNPKDLEIKDPGNRPVNAVDSLKLRIIAERCVYKCRTCKLRFMRPVSLRVHNVLMHAVKAMYSCSVCGRRFVDKVMLLLHFTRIHRKSASANRECDFCEERFVSDSLLKQHLRVHMS